MFYYFAGLILVMWFFLLLMIQTMGAWPTAIILALWFIFVSIMDYIKKN